MAIREIVNGIRFQEIKWSDSETRYIKTYLNKDELFVQFQYKDKRGFVNAINKEKNKQQFKNNYNDKFRKMCKSIF